MMDITIFTNNSSSWYIKYGNILNKRLNELGHNSIYIQRMEEIQNGDICLLLSCTKILPKHILKLNKYNIVVHASDLPKGKGFSPLQWQILEGNDNIILTLFNAIEELDTGDYYLKDKVDFAGHELLDEMHKMLGIKINEMIEYFIQNITTLKPKKQIGESTFYSKRTLDHDKLDPNKTIIEQFNHFRIANNKDYPLYFEYKGYKYNLKIEKRNKNN